MGRLLDRNWIKQDLGTDAAQELYLDPSSAGYTSPSEIIVTKLHELHAKSDYTGRASVPVLWDRRLGKIVTVLSLLALIQGSVAFAPLLPSSQFGAKPTSALFAEEGNKAGPLVSGEELEMILTELEKPLVINAY